MSCVFFVVLFYAGRNLRPLLLFLCATWSWSSDLNPGLSLPEAEPSALHTVPHCKQCQASAGPRVFPTLLSLLPVVTVDVKLFPNLSISTSFLSGYRNKSSMILLDSSFFCFHRVFLSDRALLLPKLTQLHCQATLPLAGHRESCLTPAGPCPPREGEGPARPGTS